MTLSKFGKKIIIFQITLFILLLAADLLSKHFIMRFLENETFGYYVLIDKVLALRYSLNEGAGFGIFAGRKGFLITFTTIAIAAIIALLVVFNVNKQVEKKGGILLSTSFVMILAGGIGNLVDRIAFGHVRDFIEYTLVETLFNRRFAICNIADVALTVGVVLLIIYVLFFYQEKKKPSAEPISSNETDKTSEDDNINEALKMYNAKYSDLTNSLHIENKEKEDLEGDLVGNTDENHVDNNHKKEKTSDLSEQ